jgi:hypothetical protein
LHSEIVEAEKAAVEPFKIRHPMTLARGDDEELDDEDEAFAEGVDIGGKIKMVLSPLKQARKSPLKQARAGVGAVREQTEEGKRGYTEDGGREEGHFSAHTGGAHHVSKTHYAAHKLGHGAHFTAHKLGHGALEVARREALLEDARTADEARQAAAQLEQWRRDRKRRERELDKAEKVHERALRDATEQRRRKKAQTEEVRVRREREHMEELNRLAEEQKRREEAHAHEVQREGEECDVRVAAEAKRRAEELATMRERMQGLLSEHSEGVRRTEQQYQQQKLRGGVQEEHEQGHEQRLEELRNKQVEAVSALHEQHSERQQVLDTKLTDFKEALKKHATESTAKERALREELATEVAELHAARSTEADRETAELERQRQEHEAMVVELTRAWKEKQQQHRVSESEAINAGVKLEADAQRRAEEAAAARQVAMEAASAAAEARQQAADEAAEAERQASLPPPVSLAAFMVQMPLDARPGSIMLVQVPGGGDMTMQVQLPANVPPGQCFSVMPPGTVEAAEAAAEAAVAAEKAENRREKTQPAKVLQQWYRFVLSRLVHTLHVLWQKRKQRAWTRWIDRVNPNHRSVAAHAVGLRTLFRLWPRLRTAMAMAHWKNIYLGFTITARVTEICDRKGLEVRM